MPEISDNIIIGKNYIRYNDIDLKISNIARTWVFQFWNREKNDYEQYKRAYMETKERYVDWETRNKKGSVRACITIATIFFIIFLIAFIITMLVGKKTLPEEIANLPIGIISLPIGILSFVVAGILAYAAYKINNKNITYHVAPPPERDFPEKYGLGIEMTSGHKVYFTAIDSGGYLALRKLQDDINNADAQQGITVFNMNDNSITVENNDGIINTGNHVDNFVGVR